MSSSDSSDCIARWLTLEDLRHQFELAWRAGQPRCVEEYLEAVPPPDRELLFVELLGVELQLRHSRRDEPQVDDYRDRFPQYAEQVARVFREALPLETTAGGTPLRPGVVWGDFRVIREIGRGGMGVVYEAEELALGRAVALKVLLIPGDNQLARARFLREARAAAGLHHSHIVPVLAVGQHAGSLYYAMQLIRGQTLQSLIRDPRPAGRSRATPTPGADTTAADPDQACAHQRPGQPAHPPLSEIAEVWPALAQGAAGWTYVARIGCQVARALQYAHERGIVHRDVKPANVLVDPAGDAWLADFGVAKLDDSDLTRRDEILGTLRYLAPESLDGQPDARSDVYALGLTLYELLAGASPFAATERGQLLEQLRTARLTPLSHIAPRVPRDLATIVAKATHRDPRDRYQTAGELADDLERFRRDEPIHARRHTRAELAVRLVRRNPLLSALSGAVVLLLLVGALGSLRAAFHFRRMQLEQQQLADEREWQRRAADTSAAQARTAEHQVLHTLAQLHRDAGLSHLEQGDSLQALLSTVQALTQTAAPAPADAEPGTLSFEVSLRYRIAGLLASLPPVVARQTFDQYEWKQMVFDPFTGTHDTNAPNLCFLPDGTLSVVSKGHDVAFRWDPDAAQVQRVPWDTAGSAELPPAERQTTAPPQVCYALDGRHGLTYDRDGQLELRRCDTASWVVRLEQAPRGQLPILGCWLSPDEQRVVVGLAEGLETGAVLAWDVPSGRRLSAEPWRVTGSPSPYWLRVQFSDDSRRVLVAGREAIVGDTATGALVPTGADPLTGMAVLSRSGKYLIAPALAQVRVHEITTPASSTPTADIALPPGTVITAIAGDPGDRWAVLGTDAGDLYVIDIAQRTVAQRPTRHSDRPVRELVVSPLGEAVAVCDWAGRTRVYHVPTTAPLTPPFELPEPVVSLAWRGDGQRLAAATETGDGTVWDVSAVTSRRMFDPTSRGCALSPDRRRLASWGPELETRVWDVTRLPTAPVARLRDVGAATAQWHPDGDRLAIVSKQQADGAAVDIRLWEVRAAQITRVPLQQSHDWRPSFIGLEFVGQGEQLVFGGTCGPVIVDVGSGAEILQATLRTPPAFVPYCCAVSDRFVAACRRFTVTTEVNCLRVWTPAGAVAYETVLPARLRVKGLAWSPDGSHLAAHGEFGLLMWRTRDWQPVPLSGEVAESTVELLAFDPAGRRVALVDDNAVCRVVPVETPLQRGREFCIASRPRQLSFSRDGKRLAVVTYAQGVTVWDWWRGQPLSPPLRSDTQLTQATFAADDTALIVSHRPGGLEWIAVPPAPSDSPDELVRVAQRATGFSLAEGMPPQFMTADQWHRLASRSTPPRE